MSSLPTIGQKPKFYVDGPYTVAISYVSGTSNAEYIGTAITGSSKAAAVWQIKKLTYSTNDVTDIQWADGNELFDNTWNSRTGYTYS